MQGKNFAGGGPPALSPENNVVARCQEFSYPPPADKEEAIEALHCSVCRTELVLARMVEMVKEEEVDQVVEVEMEAEEMQEGMVKEEVEAKVVVETPAQRGEVS